MNEIALVTPTSDRHVAFGLCERWMSRAIAHYGHPVTWYVADDGLVPVQCSMGQIHIRRTPSRSSRESFLGNISSLLQTARETKILFIEDDDWYAADYISSMSRWLDNAELVGESHARYYNVADLRYKVFLNASHASLCQTGIRASLLGTCRRLVDTGNTVFIDSAIWRIGQEQGWAKIANQTKRSLGIKGLPGKHGLSEGHSGEKWGVSDLGANVIKSWIGEDYEAYRNRVRSHLE